MTLSKLQRERERQRERDTQRERETERETQRETNRERDREGDRQKDRQTDRDEETAYHTLPQGLEAGPALLQAGGGRSIPEAQRAEQTSFAAASVHILQRHTHTHAVIVPAAVCSPRQGSPQIQYNHVT